MGYLASLAICYCSLWLRISGSSVSGVADQSLDASDAWKEVTDWMKTLGATVHSGLQGNVTRHGGADIRGVITNVALSDQDVLLEVPPDARIDSETVPQLAPLSSQHLKGCESVEMDFFLGAASLAIETKLGQRSRFYTYISQLPTLEDYEAFHPRAMSESVQSDFIGLDIVSSAVALIEADAASKPCFNSLKKKTFGVMEDLSWEDMKLALFRFRTRCYGYEDGSNRAVLVPGSDLLNTGPENDINSFWGFQHGNGNFVIKVNAASVAAGSELYDPYCMQCDNQQMMMIWGIYMEDNPNAITKACPQSIARLRSVSEQMLDLDSLEDARSRGLTAPRCKPDEVGSRDQGPLRCSLARLAFEQCGRSWGYTSEKVSLAGVSSSIAARSLSPKEVAKLVDRSARGRVPEALLQGYKVQHAPALAADSAKDGHLNFLGLRVTRMEH